MVIQGYGDSRPLDSNDTPEGRSNNRRVEITIQMAETNSVPDTGSTTTPSSTDDNAESIDASDNDNAEETGDDEAERRRTFSIPASP